MKRTIPLLITSIGGLILVASAFIPAAQGAGETVTMWFNILAAIAMVLGGANLAQVQLKLISDRQPGWGYAVIVLVSFVATLVAGLGKFGVRPDTASQFPGELWEPVPLDAFATTTFALTPREQEVLAPVIDRIRQRPPASVASQISLGADAISFLGWINDDQTRDLIKADDDVLWKSVAERLGQSAAAPEALGGNLIHRGDRNVLGTVGTMSIETASALKNELEGVDSAIDRLTSRAGQVTQIPFDNQGLGLNDASNLTASVTGAMTPDEYTRRRREFHNQIDRLSYTAEEATGSANDLGLEGEARKLFTEAVTRPIDRDAIILAVDSAAAATNSPRSWTDIAADVEDGDPSPPLEVESPALEPMNDGQKAQLRELMTGPFDVDALHAFFDSFPDRQRDAAYAAFRQLPSTAEREREIAFELLASGAIDRAAADALLQRYRIQRQFENALEAGYRLSQQQKFAYAADYTKNGSAFWWIYEYLFKPLTATIFALLAFYISSAAFRAFRAKNLEAALLLGTAFIVLLGRTFAGVWLTSWMPDWLDFLKIDNLTVFIMKVFNTAGNRAIMIGIALGIISTSLKVLLGMDRSYLGKE